MRTRTKVNDCGLYINRSFAFVSLYVLSGVPFRARRLGGQFPAELYTRFVGWNNVSLDGVNEYRLEAYATLLFGASSDSYEVMRQNHRLGDATA
jgi:hypothetical protein